MISIWVDCQSFPKDAVNIICLRRRHPASGYVQGINDLVTPFLAVFLGDHLEGAPQGLEAWDISALPQERLLEVRKCHLRP